MTYTLREIHRKAGFWQSKVVGTFDDRIEAIRFAVDCAVEEMLYDGPCAGQIAGFEVMDENGEILDQYDTSTDRLEIWHAA